MSRVDRMRHEFLPAFGPRGDPSGCGITFVESRRVVKGATLSMIEQQGTTEGPLAHAKGTVPVFGLLALRLSGFRGGIDRE